METLETFAYCGLVVEITTQLLKIKFSLPFQRQSRLCMVAKSISLHIQSMVATITLVGIYRGIESFHGFVGGAGLRPSTVLLVLVFALVCVFCFCVFVCVCARACVCGCLYMSCLYVFVWVFVYVCVCAGAYGYACVCVFVYACL